MSEIDRAEATWDQMDVTLTRSVAWLGVPSVSRDIWAHFGSGEGPVVHVCNLLAAAGRTDALVGAALVCGDMQSERIFFENTPKVTFARVEGYDLSQVSLDRYQPTGVEWVPHKVDCNQLDLPSGAYDLVVASHGAHHVMELDRLFSQAAQSLRSGGLMYMYEWIGPAYLCVPRRNRLVASLLVLALFPKRRTRTTHMGLVKGLRWVMGPADPKVDPSEACNSPALYPAFKRNFEVVDAYHHGALTYPVFEGIGQHIDETRPSIARRVRFVLTVERWLTSMRVVKPLFVVAVGQRKAD